MKAKTLILVILATVGLLSFTVISKSTGGKTGTTKPVNNKVDTSGGLAAVDANEWK